MQKRQQPTETVMLMAADADAPTHNLCMCHAKVAMHKMKMGSGDPKFCSTTDLRQLKPAQQPIGGDFAPNEHLPPRITI